MKRGGRRGKGGIRQCRALAAATSIAALLLALAAKPATAIGPGDCNNDDQISVAELSTGVAILLGSLPLERCAALDFDLDGTATVPDLVRAVAAALQGVSVLKVRGVIEGFYGPPYTFEQRREMVRFLPRAGLNTYVYAPKLDPLHREQWRDPYPAAFLDHFRELTAIGAQLGVRFVYSLAPGQSFDPAAGDTARVEEKLGSLFDAGVLDFCLLFDDIAADGPAAEPDVQVDLANATLAFLRGLDAATTLCFIGNYYNGTAQELATDSSPFELLYPTSSSPYYEAYRRMDAEIPILWTGPRVFSDRITLEEARRFRDFVGRPVLVWDNYPVNDVLLQNELFLAPYRGRDPGLQDALEGILLNPMLQPEASKIALWTAGRSFALGDDYDPDLAVRQALAVVGGGSEALAALAEHFRSHPLIGHEPEAPQLAAAMDDFLAGGSTASRERLVALLDELADVDRRLDEELGNRALAAELAEPARKLSLSAQAALLAVDLLARARGGTPVSTDELRSMLTEIAAIPWLVGANTFFAPAGATFFGERPATEADVFGRFFSRVLQEIEAG
jgi:hyaluronoglucosaminidase